MKALYYGDNLQVLRNSIATESVDLIYLDPPFNSNATYNVGLLGESGRDRMRGRTAACSQERSFGRPNKRNGRELRCSPTVRVQEWAIVHCRIITASADREFPAKI